MEKKTGLEVPTISDGPYTLAQAVNAEVVTVKNEQQKTVLVRLQGLSTAEANQCAAELENQLRRVTRDQVQIQRRKEREETQDFGATLVVILGTPAALAVAKGIRDFIAKSGNRVVIETDSGKVVATGDAARNIDVAATTAELQKP